MTSLEDRFEQVAARIKGQAEDLQNRKNRRDLLREQEEQLEEQIENARKAAADLLEARSLFEHLTESKRELVREKIEALVTYGIRSVFGDDYTFQIEQKMARNQVTFEYRILQQVGDDQVQTDLRGARGGGLIALTGFLLRLVMVLFVHPPRRRVMFLDETFAALDSDKRPALAKLLQSLGKSLGCQFVLITHSPEYVDEADVAYEIRRKGTASEFNRIS